MARFAAVLASLAILATAGATHAKPPAVPMKIKPGDLFPILAGGTTDALSGAIRGYLVKNLPDPLYEDWPGWGHTTPGLKGIKWHDGLPEVMHGPKKEGQWRHLKVSAISPADNAVFDIRDFETPEPGRMTFKVFLSFDVRFDYEREHWERGVRLHNSSVRARMRIKLALDCEATVRMEEGKLLPDAVCRLCVTHAELSYDNFVTEHVAGMGGEAAKVLGDAVKGGLRKWRPALERDIITKANAAIEKSADTKEVRLSLLDLFKKKAKNVETDDPG